jgi:sugar O-acyltransferase (sialic acid O-acetyltransferase NeuD family)
VSGGGCVVFGAGGHGRVVADCAFEAGKRLLGFVDDGVAPGTRIGELAVLGPASWLAQSHAAVLLGIGDNAARERVAGLVRSFGLQLESVVHPTAAVSSGAELGEGTVVLALAVVNTGARVGRGVIVNSGAVVEHDVAIGDFAHVSPNATLGGAARLGARAHLGLSACVLPGKSVGVSSVVGAGAVVTRDVESSQIVVGVPARMLASRV